MSQLELNQGDNFKFGVDVSRSMEEKDCPGGLSRIAYLKEQTIAFAREASKYDPDGIDVYTFGATVKKYANITADRAADVIGGLQANESATQTHLLIQQAYDDHKKEGHAQTVLFIATDGAPSDKDAVRGIIRKIASEIKDEHEFAISFLQVGNDAGIAQFLAELDDNLNAKYDIVDVKRLDQVNFLEAFDGALHD